jgi:hypothetical protein
MRVMEVSTARVSGRVSIHSANPPAYAGGIDLIAQAIISR